MGDRPAALADGEPIRHRDLFAAMAEQAGSAALREVVLDRALDRELSRRGMSIESEDTERERERLARTFGVDAQADELLREVLAARGLGPARLGTLLRRNAALRALIDPVEAPSDESLRVAHEVRHGQKHRVRIAVFTRASEAAAGASEIRTRAQTEGMTAAFAGVAAQRSIDESGPRGGLVGDLSTSDPGLPASLRRAISTAETGAIGEIVALDQGFALVLVESIIPPDGVAFEDTADSLRTEVRDRAERLAMEELANSLVLRSQITPLDPALRWSWDRSASR